MFEEYLLSLDGFVAGPNNNVTFADLNAWAPYRYSISIQVCGGQCEENT